MNFNLPIAISKKGSAHISLWRRLFMEALISFPPSAEECKSALYSAALLSDCRVSDVVDGLVEAGLRAPLEFFPEGWVHSLRARVLDLSVRRDLGFGLASFAAQLGWMPAPLPQLKVNCLICAETDPYGADLITLTLDELGPEPRFGYRPASIRMALLRLAFAMGCSMVDVVNALITRGVRLLPECVPLGTHQQLLLTASHPLVVEALASWRSGNRSADVIPLRRGA